MRPFLSACIATLTFSSFVSAASAAERTSQLWGRDGEAWDPAGRLADFSFAGYRRGEAQIPEVKQVASVAQFGAKGDDDQDDTAAFKKAIAETKSGAICVPPGRYVITEILEVRKPNLVLRGAGPDKTTLFFPKPLEHVRPNMGDTSDGRPTSNYSWSGGFVWLRGDFQSDELAKVAEPANRGATRVALASVKGLKVGQEIEIRQDDQPDNSLAAHLYAGQPGDMSKIGGRTRASLTCRITAIDGDSVTIDRALRFDLDPARWNPRVLQFAPTVRESGVEGLRFAFPPIPYEGHFTELGNNPIALQGVSDCWVRDVVVDDCDSGIFAAGRFCTIADVVFNSRRRPDPAGQQGHHGVTMSGDDNLLTRFRFNFKFIHDITGTAGGAGNVAAGGSGVDLCFDHHKRAPHTNLYTDIDAGAGTRLWKSGGGAALGRHAGAWTTFWNVRTQQPQTWPPERYCPDLVNLIGLRSEETAIRDADGKWFEPVGGDGAIAPADLHRAQLERRLSKRDSPPPAVRRD
jgi:hypothetical protein